MRLQSGLVMGGLVASCQGFMSGLGLRVYEKEREREGDRESEI